MGETTALRLKRVEKRARAASDVDRLPLGDIRKVELMFEDGSPQSYFVHKDDVETLIKATLKLHYDPGVNPVTGDETSKVWQIRVGKLKREGPYWWTTPALEGGKGGAHIFDCYGTECVWMSEEADRRFAENDD